MTAKKFEREKETKRINYSTINNLGKQYLLEFPLKFLGYYCPVLPSLTLILFLPEFFFS